MPSREQQKISKAANFKGAVETNKALLQRDSQCRAIRYEKIGECLAGVGDDAAKVLDKFNERERQGLLAARKRWSMDDFETQRVIGEGGFGKVLLVKRSGTEEFYAMKQMKKSHYRRKNTRDRVFAERNILAEAQTRWFVTLHFAFQDADHIFMGMEFLQGGDLIFHLIKKVRFTHEETQFYMAELLEALDTVHKLGFVHRDVKPDNLVLTAQGHMKLLDFGLCKHAGFREEQAPEVKANAASSVPAEVASNLPSAIQHGTTRAQLRSQVGTPQYMAPEVWDGDYGPEADIWSLGVLTFECLVGHVPFHADDREGVEMIRVVGQKVRDFERILPKLFVRSKQKQYLTDGTMAFLSKVICRRGERLNAQQCRDDPFFSGIDFVNLHLMQPPIVPDVKHAGDASFFDDFDDLSSRTTANHNLAVKKDKTLEWSGYEFCRTVQKFQGLDDIGQFGGKDDA